MERDSSRTAAHSAVAESHDVAMISGCGADGRAEGPGGVVGAGRDDTNRGNVAVND